MSINVKESWLSDHPLISQVYKKEGGETLKLGVFNVLSKFASEIGENVKHIDAIYKAMTAATNELKDDEENVVDYKMKKDDK